MLALAISCSLLYKEKKTNKPLYPELFVCKARKQDDINKNIFETCLGDDFDNIPFLFFFPRLKLDT